MEMKYNIRVAIFLGILVGILVGIFVFILNGGLGLFH